LLSEEVRGREAEASYRRESINEYDVTLGRVAGMRPFLEAVHGERAHAAWPLRRPRVHAVVDRVHEALEVLVEGER